MDPTTQRMLMASSGGRLGIEWEDKSFHLDDGAGAIVRDIYAVELCGGVFIAVGSNATILRSTDGISWTRVPPPVGTPSSTLFTGVAYNSSLNRVVVVGISGIIYSNNLGIGWATSDSGGWSDIAFGNSRFVVVGTSGISYSTDGLTWTAATLPAGVVETPATVAYGTPSGVSGGRFVVAAVGDGVTTTGTRYLSSDATGVTWANNGIQTTEYAFKVRYAAGSVNLYIVTGYIISTGLAFVRTGAAGNSLPTLYTNNAQIGNAGGRSIIYTGSTIVIGSDNNQVVTSTNGTTWTVAQSTQSTDSTIQAMAYSSGLGRYVFVGHATANDVQGRVAACIWYSSNVLRSGSTLIYDGGTMYATTYVASLGKYFVAGQGGKIFTSSDLETWTGKYLSQNVVIYGLYFDGTKLVASGYTPDAAGSVVYNSTDGVTWTQVFTGASLTAFGGLYGGYNSTSTTHVVYGTGNQNWYSSDGVNWSINTSTPTSFYSAVRINDPNIGSSPLALFGSIGSFFSPTGAKVYSSTNPGVSFSLLGTIPPANTGGAGGTSAVVEGVAYVQKPTLADSRIIYLVNRATPNTYLITTPYPTFSYTNQSTGSAAKLNGIAVTSNSSTIVVVGAQQTSGYFIPYIQTSTNTTTWTQRVTPGGTNYRGALQAVEFANNKFIAVGVFGIVLVSQ